MVLATSETNGEFVGETQAGRGLTRVENHSLRACDCVDELSSQGSDAGHTAQEVQRDALAGEECACWSFDVCEHVASCDFRAVFYFGDERDVFVQGEKDLLREV